MRRGNDYGNINISDKIKKNSIFFAYFFYTRFIDSVFYKVTFRNIIQFKTNNRTIFIIFFTTLRDYSLIYNRNLNELNILPVSIIIVVNISVRFKKKNTHLSIACERLNYLSPIIFHLFIQTG